MSEPREGESEPGPEPCPANPGSCTSFQLALSDGEQGRVETVDLVRIAAETLRGLDHAASVEGRWLSHDPSGLLILPQLVELVPLDGGAVRTVTTIQVNHPRLCPGGLFEYQHSTGPDAAGSIARGFDQWARTDLVALLDALRPTPGACMVMQMQFPEADGRPARGRRAILGPIAHLAERPTAPAEKGPGDEHDFCPCCLLTRSFEAFKGLFEAEGTFGIRLFAMRDAEGGAQADCRVNGEDWQAGAEALRKYVETWPPAGFEFRKQYVVLHDHDGSPGA